MDPIEVEVMTKGSLEFDVNEEGIVVSVTNADGDYVIEEEVIGTFEVGEAGKVKFVREEVSEELRAYLATNNDGQLLVS